MILENVSMPYLSSLDNLISLGAGLLAVDAFEITVAGLAVVSITSLFPSLSSRFFTSPERTLIVFLLVSDEVEATLGQPLPELPCNLLDGPFSCEIIMYI